MSQFGPVKKKPFIAEETAAPYAAKKPAKGKAAAKNEATSVRYLDAKTAGKLTKDILDKHHELFRKLAQ